MRISRAKVIRLLAAARDGGIVRIRIEARGSEQIALERKLMTAFGLREAIVVPAPVDDADIATVVGHAAGTYLSDQVREGPFARCRLGRHAQHEPESALQRRRSSGSPSFRSWAA